MFRKALNFFHILDIQPMTELFPEAHRQTVSDNPVPAQVNTVSCDGPGLLEHGEYSILDNRGYVLVAHISLPEVKRLAPIIAQKRKMSVRILKHA